MKYTIKTTKSIKSYRKISGSEAIVRCLLKKDVNIIYGYPGGAIMPVYDELYNIKIKFIMF